MTDVERLKLKGEIASAPTIEEANWILEQQTGLKSFAEKRAFIERMFCTGSINVDEIIYLHYLKHISNRFKGF